MYSMFLADDESIILKGLHKLVDWQELDIEIIGEAMDGSEAEKSITELNPDIAILDIRMPTRTGLDILRTISDLELKTQVIFLSGYAEFTYVQEAMQYGATEYLTKPVRKEKLINAVTKVRKRIDSHSTIQIAMEKLSHYENSPYARLEDIDAEKPFYTALAITVQSTDNFDSEMERLVLFSVLQAIKRVIDDKMLGIAFTKDSTIFVLLNHNNGNNPLYDTVSVIVNSVRVVTGKELLVGIGKTTDSISSVHQSIITARSALNYRFFKTEDTIFYTDTVLTVDNALQENSTIGEILAYISENYAKDMTLEVMAKVSYMNPYYFSAYFKKHTGMNFKEYVTKIRMDRALELLKYEDLSTYEVAESVGFCDARYFGELFKKTYGVTPAEVKRGKKTVDLRFVEPF